MLKVLASSALGMFRRKQQKVSQRQIGCAVRNLRERSMPAMILQRLNLAHMLWKVETSLESNMKEMSHFWGVPWLNKGYFVIVEKISNLSLQPEQNWRMIEKDVSTEPMTFFFLS